MKLSANREGHEDVKKREQKGLTYWKSGDNTTGETAKATEKEDDKGRRTGTANGPRRKTNSVKLEGHQEGAL